MTILYITQSQKGYHDGKWRDYSHIAAYPGEIFDTHNTTTLCGQKPSPKKWNVSTEIGDLLCVQCSAELQDIQEI